MLESNHDALKFWNEKQTAFRNLQYTCNNVYSYIATHIAKALERKFSMLTEYSYRQAEFFCMFYGTEFLHKMIISMLAVGALNWAPAGVVYVFTLLGG